VNLGPDYIVVVIPTAAAIALLGALVYRRRKR
jgi:hypothetical protein